MSPSTEPTLPPPTSAEWIRPRRGLGDEPRWGLPGALQVGLPPTPGPRGLLRIFTPYLDHPHERLINFVAIEPIPDGATARGFSELEPSTLDPGQAGKRLWSANTFEDAAVPGDPSAPASGVIDEVDGNPRLTVWVGVERFDNGADVAVRVRLRADRPHEVELAGFARDSSVPLAHLVLTATMGNWARLRELHLADRVVHPRELWPGFTRTDFTEHARFPLPLLARDGNAAVVTATGDERDPLSVTYADDTHAHWRFEGRRARQGWRVDDPHPALVAQVNGRWAYWASASPIPGGVAYENLEIVEPFRQGAALRFFVDPLDDTAS
ncbi:hypothetical protein [Microbacterium sp. TNHR37B]|uniref:hypothetical protein n=1 Tax=Microbacterium sp. TNHR37B TaxID=1775956 RepID=UPI0007B17DA7|nr:hypothetical protein [Microbacterium sp. TNHR37B]KZE90055.1 hypothetical protein AVP41_02858 [Microbacterium sp. TNHR37B]